MYDAVPEATPASQAVAAAATRNNAARANATIHQPKSAAPVASPVQKGKPASTVVVVTLANPSAVHQRAITLRHPSAVEVRVFTVQRAMIVSRAVDVVPPDRRDAGTVSAMIPRRRHAVRDRGLFGLVTKVMSAALLEVVRILRPKSVARMEVVRKERRAVRMNAVDRVDTVDRTDTARLVPFPRGPSPRRMRSLQLL